MKIILLAVLAYTIVATAVLPMIIRPLPKPACDIKPIPRQLVSTKQTEPPSFLEKAPLQQTLRQPWAKGTTR